MPMIVVIIGQLIPEISSTAFSFRRLIVLNVN